MAKILLIEDDDLLAQMVERGLQSDKYDTDRANDGSVGLSMLLTGSYDMCIVDWHLPNMTGIEIIDNARGKGVTLPILMLTSRSSKTDTVSGLSTGADDYLTKPFEMSELQARVKALLRRPKKLTGNEISCGDITVSISEGRAYKSGKLLELSPTEFAVLEFFMRNQGRVFTAEELLDRVWMSDSDATYSAVTTFVKRLRQKLEQNRGDSIIKTVHGIGYKAEGPPKS
ncbi:MAG TPA: response regulator transcription factor [Oculatellaceae cyanobacterium]